MLIRACLLLAALPLLLGAVPAAADPNQPPPGFSALFNGRDLASWQGLIELPKRAKLSPEELKAAQLKADELMRAHWSVKDGVLAYDGKGNSLQTARDYGNFELYVDWKIAPKGDSGIYLRGNPQVQIWAPDASDAARDADGKFIGSGGLFNNQNGPSRPLVAADRPAGEWNTFWVRMVGDRVTVKLNGEVVVNDVAFENYWERGKPLPARGPIELQHHYHPLEFRNIFIKELPDTAERPGKTVSIEVAKAPLSQLIQLLAAQGGVEIVVRDPDGTLLKREVPFVSIRERPIVTAVEAVCRAAGLECRRDPDGVFVLWKKGQPPP